MPKQVTLNSAARNGQNYRACSKYLYTKHFLDADFKELKIILMCSVVNSAEILSRKEGLIGNHSA